MNATTKRRTYEFFINDWYDFNYWLENNQKFNDNKSVYSFRVWGTKPFEPYWEFKLGMWKIKLFVYKNAKFKLRDYLNNINTYDREAYIDCWERREHQEGLKNVLDNNNIENRI